MLNPDTNTNFSWAREYQTRRRIREKEGLWDKIRGILIPYISLAQILVMRNVVWPTMAGKAQFRN